MASQKRKTRTFKHMCEEVKWKICNERKPVLSNESRDFIWRNMISIEVRLTYNKPVASYF